MAVKLGVAMGVMTLVTAGVLMTVMCLAVCMAVCADPRASTNTGIETCMRQDECPENYCCVRNRDEEKVGKCLPYSNTNEFCEVIHNISMENYHFCPCLDPKQVCRGRGFGGKCLIVNWNYGRK